MQYEKKVKQLWSTIPPISTKRTLTSHKKRPGHMTLEIQVQKNVEGVKPVNVIPTRPLLIIGSPMYKLNTKINDKVHILTQK